MFYKILKGALAYAPIGIFAIGAATFGSQGWETLKSLFTFVWVFYLGLLILWVIVYAGALKISGTPVLHFFKQTKEAYMTAFFTSSIIVSLPLAISSQKKQVSRRALQNLHFHSVLFLILMVEHYVWDYQLFLLLM